MLNWAQARGKKYGIPPRALQAYGYATVVMAKTSPGCHLGWTTLAAIARVESDHGRHRGAKAAADGQVSPPIRGVALDGTNGNARILDPGATARAGHAVFAQAAGPFQFIPDTWKRWGVHAGVDYPTLSAALKKAEPVVPEAISGSPDNIDDAALAAGRYLCASGGDLATAAGWRRAVFAYNHSDAYVRQIHAAASGYSKSAR
ncbi:murein transglycosylase [Nocardia salmonicida]|uniref:murein transglycosylase n=1 Tax=Nocardia salmonicida TaxID=53431 RepID=UPI00365B89B0